MSRWIQGLNPEQQEAVTHRGTPLLVLAGAGSGKTRVITHRIAHLIEEGVSPEHILGVTFTNKAAAEMRQRLGAMVGTAARGVTLSTFHALGLEMLRQEARRSRRSRPFTIFDTGDQLATLRQLLRESPADRGYDLGAVLARISAYKNAFVSPEAVTPGEDPYDQIAAALYPDYVAQLKAFRAYDFDDLICEPVRLLERSESARARWEDRFRHVLVDEYQDTNTAQLRLLLALAGRHRNVTVVGDDDQSIYGWRGADVRNILQFERDFPGAHVVYLMRNYRSVGRVLELANRVISENPERHPKAMIPVRESGERVRLVLHPDGEAEASWVARTIDKLLREERLLLGDIAVLYRSNTQARALETELRMAKLPYRVIGGTSFYDRREVKDLIAYFKVCVNPRDEISLRRIINTPPRGIGPRTVEKLAAWAEAHGASLWDALGEAETALADDPRAQGAAARFRRLIQQAAGRLRRGSALVEAAEALVAESGMVEEIQRSSESDAVRDRRLAMVNGFLTDLRRYAQQTPRPSLREHLSRISLAELETGAGKEERDQVTLCTLHGAKGLEFPVVFLVGLEEGLLPHDRTLNPQVTDHVTGDIAEERRLFYVGITRAQDRLYLSRAQTRVVRGRSQPRSPTRFLESVPEDWLDLEDLTQPASTEAVSELLADFRSKMGW